jgi:hypothetical protein
MDKGTVLTGREDFPWEEHCVFASRNRVEYERLKKENPSYQGEYTLIGISKEEVEENDLVANLVLSGDCRYRLPI